MLTPKLTKLFVSETRICTFWVMQADDITKHRQVFRTFHEDMLGNPITNFNKFDNKEIATVKFVLLDNPACTFQCLIL